MSIVTDDPADYPYYPRDGVARLVHRLVQLERAVHALQGAAPTLGAGLILTIDGVVTEKTWTATARTDLNGPTFVNGMDLQQALADLFDVLDELEGIATTLATLRTDVDAAQASADGANAAIDNAKGEFGTLNGRLTNMTSGVQTAQSTASNARDRADDAYDLAGDALSAAGGSSGSISALEARVSGVESDLTNLAAQTRTAMNGLIAYLGQIQQALQRLGESAGPPPSPMP